MSPDQKKWLEANPNFEAVRFFGMVVTETFADKKWLLANGDILPEPPKFMPYVHGAFSSGNTLYVNQPPPIEVGRRVSIC